ncbi:MAG: FAD:protein FMN transferase [Minisyncoccia bacterium]
MKETRLIMGMPIEIEIVPTSPRLRGAGSEGAHDALEAAFAYLVAVDKRFSTYKEDSEISHINNRKVEPCDASEEMKEVFDIAEQTKQETKGYFDIHRPKGGIDPSGVVKGWAIRNTAALIRKAGYEQYFVNAGGDIAMNGKNALGEEWSVGIRNPFNIHEIVKVVYPRGKGIATSGSYIRGDHVYNPHKPEEKLRDVVSITVIGPDVLAADLMATAAFAMGKEGIAFIGQLQGFEGYAIDAQGIATMTVGFGAYTRAAD